MSSSNNITNDKDSVTLSKRFQNNNNGVNLSAREERIIHPSPVIVDRRPKSATNKIPTTCKVNVPFKRVILLVATACVVQLFGTFVYTFRELKTVSSMGNSDRKVVPVNTNWKNVQYHSGVFGKHHLSQQEEEIHDQCDKLVGVRYFHNSLELGNNVCFGPLPTNTTCCYCFFSRDYEPFGFIGTCKYWTCAAARENSLWPVNSTLPDSKGARVAWITGKFGHNNRFQTEVMKSCQQVQEMNLFDPRDVFCYWETPDYVLQDQRFHRHLKYLTDPKDVSAKGGGFWFHKSVLLRHHLDAYQDGDIFVYTDSDLMDFFQLGTFHASVETMATRGDDLCLNVGGNAIEGKYAKGDLLAAFNASKFMRMSPQSLGGTIVIRTSPTMKRFMDAWVECMADWHMVSDEPSVLPNEPAYIDHRHDQAVMSLLVKRFMTIQAVVGPPARPYQPISQIMTYKFKDGADPLCPFAAYYAERGNATGNPF